LDVIFSVGMLEIRFSPMEQSALLPIVRAVEGKVVFRAVALSTPSRLTDEKLEVLRQLDQFLQWHSLDEQRYCLVCGSVITGRQIQVTGGIRGNGSLRLSCPKEGCNSIPPDWVLPTSEILAKVERLAAEERKAAASKPIAVASGNGKTVQPSSEHCGFVSRLLKVALAFKPYS
jgi:hypothetical protein